MVFLSSSIKRDYVGLMHFSDLFGQISTSERLNILYGLFYGNVMVEWICTMISIQILELLGQIDPFPNGIYMQCWGYDLGDVL